MLKHHERDVASLKVLLVSDVLVRRHHDFETGLLGNIDQLAVCKFFPPPRPRFFDSVARKETGEASRRAVIERTSIPVMIYL